MGLVQAQHLRAQPSPARGPVPGELSQRESRHGLRAAPGSSAQVHSRVICAALACQALFPLGVGTVPISPVTQSSNEQIAVLPHSSPVASQINGEAVQPGLAAGPADGSALPIPGSRDSGLLPLQARLRQRLPGAGSSWLSPGLMQVSSSGRMVSDYSRSVAGASRAPSRVRMGRARTCLSMPWERSPRGSLAHQQH